MYNVLLTAMYECFLSWCLPKIDGVSVAVPIASRTQRDDDDDNFPSLKFIFIPLDASNQSLDDWSQ